MWITGYWPDFVLTLALYKLFTQLFCISHMIRDPGASQTLSGAPSKTVCIFVPPFLHKFRSQKYSDEKGSAHFKLVPSK